MPGNRASQLLPAALLGQLIVFETLRSAARLHLVPSAPTAAEAGIALLLAGVGFWQARVSPTALTLQRAPLFHHRSASTLSFAHSYCTAAFALAPCSPPPRPITLPKFILQAGRSAIELALFVLLPVMVVMLSLMRLLEARGVLDWLVARLFPCCGPRA